MFFLCEGKEEYCHLFVSNELVSNFGEFPSHFNDGIKIRVIIRLSAATRCIRNEGPIRLIMIRVKDTCWNDTG